jgi:enoyl-CoA hydratase/carnithine racemase
MSMDSNTANDVLLHRVDDIVVVTLNRPHAMNAWTMHMQRRVAEAIENLADDTTAHGIVLTGAGRRAFCAGQDLAETAAFNEADVDGWLANFRRLYAALLDLDKPIVAAVNGVAAGSGYQVALLCDVRVVHPGTRMGQPEVSSGIPSITGMYLTDRALGMSRTRELMLTGRLLDAEELLRIGLVHHIVPENEVESHAVAVAQQIAAQPAVAVRLTKERYRQMVAPGLWEAFDAAREIDRRAWASGQPQETMRHFFDDRDDRQPIR